VTWLLVWQNSYMKERFWSVYYWLMIGYLVLFLYILINTTLNVKDEYHDEKSWSSSNLESKLRTSIYFNFLGFSHFSCSQLEGYGPDTIGVYFSDDKINRCKAGEVRLVRDMYIKNYYALVVVFLMTLIRFIFIGKHIWQRP